jgi:tetratricopeptide (TPR) repeat protein
VAGIRLNIGLVYFRQNNFKEAIAPFDSVVKSQPDAIQPRYLLGLCYFFIDDPANTVTTLEPLWPQQSNSLSYLYVLGNAAGQAGRKDLEQRALAQLVEIGQNSAEFHLFMGKAHLNRQEYEPAVNELKTAATMNPNLPFVHFNLGLAYFHTDDFDHAKEEFIKDIAIEPEVAFNYDQLGATNWRLQQYKEAEENFRAALSRDPRLTSSRFGLAQVYNQAGKYQAALAELDTALNLDPKNNNLHYLRGRVLLRLNRTQEAQAELTMAERIIKEQRDTRQKEMYGNLPHPELTIVP